MRALEAEQIAAGKERVFSATRAFLSREADAGEYAAVTAALNLAPGALAVTVHRLRQRYRDLVRASVADTVDGPLEVEAEMRHLLAALA
jgi:RNA polymerase sigma-70 factor (ECF subfamily)